MKKLFYGLAIAALLVLPADATVSIVQKNVQVPTTGTLTPFDFCNDGTNSWACNGIFDGTTQAGVDPTSKGLFTDIVACAVGICGLPTVTSNALVQGRISSAMTGTTQTQLIAAVTSQHIYVTSVSCKNTSAVATLVNIEDASSGTILAQLAASATYGGDNLSAGGAPLFWTTAGNALFAVNATTGASVTCNASGYSSAS